MSLHEQARKLIEQAEVAIKANNPQYATELLRQSILYNGKDADAYILLGIALAQTGMAGDAENAFKKATHIAPESVKARYNLAVHQYSQGLVRGALNSARKSVELDPEHAGSKDLVARIEVEMGLQPGEEPKTTAAGNPTPGLSSDDDEPVVPSVAFVARMGAAWELFAWLISAASLGGLLITLWLAQSYANFNGRSETAIRALSALPLGHLAQVLFFASIILSIIWTAMDAIHRGGNLLWMLPQVFCGCVGFTWVILPLYFFFGRNKSAEAPTA